MTSPAADGHIGVCVLLCRPGDLLFRGDGLAVDCTAQEGGAEAAAGCYGVSEGREINRLVKALYKTFFLQPNYRFFAYLLCAMTAAFSAGVLLLGCCVWSECRKRGFSS